MFEMLFAHLKRILGLGWLRLRGPCGANDEFLLAATAQNLRKPAKILPAPQQMRRVRQERHSRALHHQVFCVSKQHNVFPQKDGKPKFAARANAFRADCKSRPPTERYSRSKAPYTEV